MAGIGELGEGPLHAALKAQLAVGGGATEVPMGRWVVDVVTPDGELVEIQTGSFAALGPKLDDLLDTNRMRIVFPIPQRRRVIRIDADGEVLSQRWSPRRGRPLDVFDRLVSVPTLLDHPNLTLQLLLCIEDHVRHSEPTRSRSGRRRRDPGVRHLVDVSESVMVRRKTDLLGLLPGSLPGDEFSTAQFARHLGTPTVLTQRILYVLRHNDLVRQVGRRGRTPYYSSAIEVPSRIDA